MEAWNSVRFLHLSTTARRQPVFHRLHRRQFWRNPLYKQSILSGKDKNGNGKRRLEMRTRWGRNERQIFTPTFFPSQPHSCDKTIFERFFWKGLSHDMSTCCSLQARFMKLYRSFCSSQSMPIYKVLMEEARCGAVFPGNSIPVLILTRGLCCGTNTVVRPLVSEVHSLIPNFVQTHVRVGHEEKACSGDPNDLGAIGWHLRWTDGGAGACLSLDEAMLVIWSSRRRIE